MLGGLEPTSTRSTEMLIVPVVARVVRPERFVLAPGEVEVILEPRLADLLDETSWRQEEWSGHIVWFHPFPEGMLGGPPPGWCVPCSPTFAGEAPHLSEGAELIRTPDDPPRSALWQAHHEKICSISGPPTTASSGTRAQA